MKNVYAQAMANIAFIGLGVMGGPMAGHLARAGHRLRVFNRTMAKAGAWAERYDGEVAISPAQAAREADIVITCVGDDDALAEVTLGADGAFAAMTPGSLFIDHTTVSADIARRLYEEGARRGLHCVDAPVSGGQAGAENGTLSAMCGGTEPAVAAARIAMQAYTDRVTHIGGPGTGQTAKMANQICLAGLIQGLAEAVRFAQKADLDTEKLYEAISGGAAASWQMSNRWATMAQGRFDFGFAVDWMRKDLGLALDEARRTGAALPVTALVDQFYADVQAMDGGRQDSSALVRRLPGA